MFLRTIKMRLGFAFKYPKDLSHRVYRLRPRMVNE